jgi:3-deoxy-manno-octulosonate cytidylyltransferase (CMP-KDO synthetase)
MSFKVIIPARYQSTRLPGKPLLDIAGKPMIQRVYESACKSSASEVIVATDDNRIVEACSNFGAKICLTASTHQSGTDRLQEVVEQLSLQEDEIIVNVQGDEPLIAPELINQVANNLAITPWASMASLCELMNDIESVLNPNNVKVVFNKLGEALYFSRAPIPWHRDASTITEFKNNKVVYKFTNEFKAANYYRHIGIYAYRTQFLNSFVTWTPAQLEVLESLEQLRALANGNKIHMALACQVVAPGIDTQEDLDKVRQLFQ